MPYVRIRIPMKDMQRDYDLTRIVNRQSGSKQPARDIKALVNKYPNFTIDIQSTVVTAIDIEST